MMLQSLSLGSVEVMRLPTLLLTPGFHCHTAAARVRYISYERACYQTQV